MYIRFLQSQPPVTETFKILFNSLFLQNALAMIYSNCSFGRFSHFGIKMWKTIIIAVIIHMMNTKLCRGQTINVFSFSPAPFVSKYDSKLFSLVFKLRVQINASMGHTSLFRKRTII